MATPKLSTFAVYIISVLIGGISSATAGNGWNPPLPKKDEPIAHQAGAEFFRLQSQIYGFLAFVEEQNVAGAKELVPSIKDRLITTSKKCNALNTVVSESKQLQANHADFVSKIRREDCGFCAIRRSSGGSSLA